MIHSLAARGEAPRGLARISSRQVPVLAVLASVLFGFVAAGLELLFPERVLPTLLNIVGSTCLLVWAMTLVSQLILRRRAERNGTPLPFRMAGFPYLTVLALAILALIFVLLLSAPETRVQFLSMAALTAAIAVASALARRLRKG